MRNTCVIYALSGFYQATQFMILPIGYRDHHYYYMYISCYYMDRDFRNVFDMTIPQFNTTETKYQLSLPVEKARIINILFQY